MLQTINSRTLFKAAVFVALVGLVACGGKSDKPNIEPVQDMMDSPSMKEQDYEPSLPHNRGMLTPPEGTVPQGYTPYKYKGAPDKAERELKNPFVGNMSPEVLSRGKAKYDIYCMVCHGEKGAGDGPVAGKMALKPPPLISDKVKKFTDGRIYHIIVDGQGVMGSYAAQIVSQEDRWAIVNYIRSFEASAQGN